LTGRAVESIAAIGANAQTTELATWTIIVAATVLTESMSAAMTLTAVLLAAVFNGVAFALTADFSPSAGRLALALDARFAFVARVPALTTLAILAFATIVIAATMPAKGVTIAARHPFWAGITRGRSYTMSVGTNKVLTRYIAVLIHAAFRTVFVPATVLCILRTVIARCGDLARAEVTKLSVGTIGILATLGTSPLFAAEELTAVVARTDRIGGRNRVVCFIRSRVSECRGRIAIGRRSLGIVRPARVRCIWRLRDIGPGRRSRSTGVRSLFRGVLVGGWGRIRWGIRPCRRVRIDRSLRPRRFLLPERAPDRPNAKHRCSSGTEQKIAQ